MQVFFRGEKGIDIFFAFCKKCDMMKKTDDPEEKLCWIIFVLPAACLR